MVTRESPRHGFAHNATGRELRTPSPSPVRTMSLSEYRVAPAASPAVRPYGSDVAASVQQTPPSARHPQVATKPLARTRGYPPASSVCPSQYAPFRHHCRHIKRERRHHGRRHSILRRPYHARRDCATVHNVRKMCVVLCVRSRRAAQFGCVNKATTSPLVACTGESAHSHLHVSRQVCQSVREDQSPGLIRRITPLPWATPAPASVRC